MRACCLKQDHKFKVVLWFISLENIICENLPVYRVSINAPWFNEIEEQDATVISVEFSNFNSALRCISPIDVIGYPVDRQSVNINNVCIQLVIRKLL